MQVHQFHPTVTYGDAVSNQILNLQKLLRDMGYRSEVFCERLPVRFQGRVHPMEHYNRFSSPGSILLLHFSLGYSREVISWIDRVPSRRVIVYHNITPHTYFAGINESFFRAAQTGRDQLDDLRNLSEIGWGDSAFNCQELVDRGWTKVGVLPILFDPKKYEIQPDVRILQEKQTRVNVLFVSRVAPNKRFEDLLLAFYYLKLWVLPDAQLLLVGSAEYMQPYMEFLEVLTGRLGLSEVVFTRQPVSDAEMVAYYRCATVYLSMSEHEGFGVPLLESMYFGVPIIAYKAAAIPETMGGSGILVTRKDYSSIAELIGVLVEDEHLRARIVARQKERLKAFFPEQIKNRLQDLLSELKG